MKTNYKHISKRERKQIQELMQAGKTNKEIAEELERSISTIGRELKRNWGYGARWYKHERAQEFADERRKASKSPLISAKTWEVVFELFNEDLSPEQIAGVLKLQGVFVSHETIYRRIYSESRAKAYGSFLKKASLKPSKTFTHFAAMLQNGWGAGLLPCF